MHKIIKIFLIISLILLIPVSINANDRIPKVKNEILHTQIKNIPIENVTKVEIVKLNYGWVAIIEYQFPNKRYGLMVMKYEDFLGIN